MKAFDKIGFIVLITSFTATFAVTYGYSSMFFNSLFAAAMGGGFFWLGFTTLRWVIQAMSDGNSD